MRYGIMSLFVAVASCGSDENAVGQPSDVEESSRDSNASVVDVFDDGDGNSTIVVTHVISPCVLLDPVDLFFGRVAFHDIKMLWYTVQNTCAYDLNIVFGDVVDKDSDEGSADFQFETSTSELVPPGNSAFIGVRFQPEPNEHGNATSRYARAQFSIAEQKEPEKFHSWAYGNVTIALQGVAYKPDPPVAVIYAYRDADFTDEISSGDSVVINTTIYFDGQRSYSPEKQNGTFRGIKWYNWELTAPANPAGVAAHLLPTDKDPTPQLTPDRCGTYGISLVVGDWLWFNELPATFEFLVPCE